jgi:(R,R)-butanediol dehydrogenase/meso-butanediol dehydrogenase/diacetyl reductase
MKALRWHGNRDIRFEDVPEPETGAGQVKLKINLAGICGSDLKIYLGGLTTTAVDKAPITLGHEFAGEVVALGKDVCGFSIGDRVTGLGEWHCGHCRYCKKGMYNLCLNGSFTGLTEAGCMAEYMAAPANILYKLPDTVTDEEGALVEPLSVAVHAVRLGKVHIGDRVAVVGDGPIGISTLMAARAAGASEVYLVAKHKKRGDKALSMGATRVIYSTHDDPATEIAALTEGLGVDVAIECVGKPETPQLTVSLVRRGGVVVVVGGFGQASMFNFASIVRNEITIVGNALYVDEAIAVLALLADKRFDPRGLITSTVLLKDAVAMGFDRLITSKEDDVKILLQVH